ncbi:MULTISPECIES: FAD-binding oxidoreductase [Giesbergeria]|uniref:FAD-binding oxidoreductase n=1 Tax=Giesbergeria sinuosa TaxID=80883 RepID=A0ABV9QCZ7_9BURK
MSDLLDVLRHTVGSHHVLTGEGLGAWEQDWRQRRPQGKALAVVRPANTAEVAAVVRACAATGTPIVPQGGNTSLSLGSTPDASGREIVLSLARLHAIRAIDPHNLSMTLEAGCILHHAQEAAKQAGLLFPLSLASEGSCTVGGNLGTNAGGTQVVRYGNARELCLGLEVVTPQGEVWDGLRGLRKDNTGYDLRHLFIGSEGTLGIITAATMKLFPLPSAQLTAWAAVPTIEQAVALLGLAHQHLGAGLTGLELMGRSALELVARHLPHLRVPLLAEMASPWFVLLENTDSESEDHARDRFEALMEAALAAGCVHDAVVAQNQTQAQMFWQVRESISTAQAQEGLNIKHDIAIPITRIPAFVAHTDALLSQAIAGVRIINFGHLGDGNLHYNVQAPAGDDPAIFLREQEARINQIVYEAVAQFGGSFSAEHGVGALKVEQLEQYQSPVALGLMRAIKQALDPQNLMNPGRMLRL